MLNLFIGLSLLWFFRTERIVLFYVYLWQLKDYHIGRFIDHFNTYQGKKLFINPLKITKIFLVLGYFFFPLYFPLVLGIFYFFESLILFKDLIRKTLRKPVFTIKTKTITLVCTFFVLLLPVIVYYFFKNDLLKFSLGILLIDIFLPVLISIIVLLFQPFAVLGRNKIINKAKTKIETMQDLLVIGITGSYGKTSTKEFLYSILSSKFNVLKTNEHQNSEIGVSQCILENLTSEHEIFICEMGAYGKGGIKLLSDIAKPKIGIITGVNEQHLALFGSMKNLISAEGGEELINALPENGLAIFNGNNKYAKEIYQKTIKPKRIIFSGEEIIDFKPDLIAKDIKTDKGSVSFKIYDNKNQKTDFKINVLGSHNVQNLLLAAITAKDLGMTLPQISAICEEKIESSQGAMKLIHGKNGLKIIDSTYSANPDGVMSALEYIKIWPGKKIIVMPCLIELGPASSEIHKKIGRKIAEICDLAIITTKDKFKEIKIGATEKGMKSYNILSLDKPEEIFRKINLVTRIGDVVLLEGRLPNRIINLLK